MKAITTIQSTIEEYKLFEKDDRLLVAVSGGIDSSVLCHMIDALGYDFGIAHVNYQLRGIDSDADALFVQHLASKYDARFHIKVEIEPLNSEESGLSIQKAARELRYDYFQNLCDAYDYDKIITAHHASDNLETILYNLVKGGMISALRGIPIKRSNIVRPLLHTLKSSITEYAEINGIAFRVDYTNLQDKYARNYIRNQLIPLLHSLNPSIEHTMVQTSKMGYQYEILIDDLIEKEKTGLVTELEESIEIHLKKLTQSNTPTIILFHILKSYGFHYATIEDIWNCFSHDHSSGKIFKNKTYRAVISRDVLLLELNKEDHFEPKIIQSINSSLMDSNGLIQMSSAQLLESAKLEIVDADRIHFPLTLRRWQAGDRFHPLGMQGKSKKVKDFLTDLKINLFDKKRVLVIESNQEIIWVVGYRISELIAITDDTKNKLYMTVIKSSDNNFF